MKISCNDACTTPSNVTMQTECLNIATMVDDGYLSSVPVDPNAAGASSVETRYYFLKNSNKSITVGACNPEKGTNASIPSVEVSR